MEFKWAVASDHVTHLVLPVAPGRHRSEKPHVVPERYGHAVQDHAKHTVCGTPVRDLHRFDAVTFLSLGHHLL